MGAKSEAAKAKLRENQRAYALSPKGKYTSQRAHAKKRGIPFLLTFEEWWSVWEASGKFSQMGAKLGDYCMCRVGDTGPYVLGNVYIASTHHNRKEQLVHSGLTREAIIAILSLKSSGLSQAQVAKQFKVSQPYVSRLWAGNRGKAWLSKE